MPERSGSIWLGLIAIILAIGLVISVFSGTVAKSASELTSSGNAKVEVPPDQAVIFVSVETTAKSSLDSQQQNAKTSSELVSALKTAGLDDKTIETSSYSIAPEYFYPQNQPPQLTGYKTTNTLKLTIKDVTKVGQIIDTAGSAGANRVENIQFELKDETQDRMKQIVLNNAVGNARLKAEAMASALGVKLGKAKQVSENYYNVIPYVYQVQKTEAGVPAPQTPIQPGTVEVNAQVQVTYGI